MKLIMKAGKDDSGENYTGSLQVGKKEYHT